jgi:glucokinase
MALLGLDLGGTKLALAVFAGNGIILRQETVPLGNRKGPEIGILINDQVDVMLKWAENEGNRIISAGISVPGISYVEKGTVWAPNLQGWNDFPLKKEVSRVLGDIPVTIDSDRACSILGESWKGNARGCKDAIFLAVGTGIGAGIMIDVKVLRGSNDIAGAIGWMALDRPFNDRYTECGCFEYHASGEGIGKVARDLLKRYKDYNGDLRKKPVNEITAHDVFEAYGEGDPLATSVLNQGIEFWGMSVANLVSLFNPEKIIFGGGVFGPAIPLLPAIKAEALKWAQPVSINQVKFEASALAGDAAVTGAGYLALKSLENV